MKKSTENFGEGDQYADEVMDSPKDDFPQFSQLKFDSNFMKKFIHEVEDIIKTSEEYRILGNPYRISASKFATDVE